MCVTAAPTGPIYDVPVTNAVIVHLVDCCSSSVTSVKYIEVVINICVRFLSFCKMECLSQCAAYLCNECMKCICGDNSL